MATNAYTKEQMDAARQFSASVRATTPVGRNRQPRVQGIRVYDGNHPNLTGARSIPAQFRATERINQVANHLARNARHQCESESCDQSVYPAPNSNNLPAQCHSQPIGYQNTYSDRGNPPAAVNRTKLPVWQQVRVAAVGTSSKGEIMLPSHVLPPLIHQYGSFALTPGGHAHTSVQTFASSYSASPSEAAKHCSSEVILVSEAAQEQYDEIDRKTTKVLNDRIAAFEAKEKAAGRGAPTSQDIYKMLTSNNADFVGHEDVAANAETEASSSTADVALETVRTADGLKASVQTIPSSNRELIVTNWGTDPVGPQIPAHLKQTSASQCIRDIANETGWAYEDCTSDGVSVPARRPRPDKQPRTTSEGDTVMHMGGDPPPATNRNVNWMQSADKRRHTSSEMDIDEDSVSPCVPTSDLVPGPAPARVANLSDSAYAWAPRPLTGADKRWNLSGTHRQLGNTHRQVITTEKSHPNHWGAAQGITPDSLSHAHAPFDANSVPPRQTSNQLSTPTVSRMAAVSSYTAPYARPASTSTSSATGTAPSKTLKDSMWA